MINFTAANLRSRSSRGEGGLCVTSLQDCKYEGGGGVHHPPLFLLRGRNTLQWFLDSLEGHLSPTTIPPFQRRPTHNTYLKFLRLFQAESWPYTSFGYGGRRQEPDRRSKQPRKNDETEKSSKRLRPRRRVLPPSLPATLTISSVHDALA